MLYPSHKEANHMLLRYLNHIVICLTFVLVFLGKFKSIQNIQQGN